jgi:hypothetical protein
MNQMVLNFYILHYLVLSMIISHIIYITGFKFQVFNSKNRLYSILNTFMHKLLVARESFILLLPKKLLSNYLTRKNLIIRIILGERLNLCIDCL